MYDLQDEIILDDCWGYVGSLFGGIIMQIMYGAQDANSRYQSLFFYLGRSSKLGLMFMPIAAIMDIEVTPRFVWDFTWQCEP